MDDSVPSTVTRRVSWLYVTVHILLMIVLVVMMFVNEPRVWHRSFFVLEEDPHDIGSSDAGFYEAKIVNDGDSDPMGAWTAASCGGYGAESDLDVWHAGDEVNAHHTLSNRARDYCRFQRVGKSWVHGGDPRSFHIFSSATPAFLLVSIQVIVASSLLATSSALKNFFSTPLCGMGRSRVWSPLDPIAASILMFGWVAPALLMQTTFVIVYNNLLFIGLTSIFTAAGFIVWSWRKSVPSGYSSLSKVEPVFDDGPDAEFSGPMQQASMKRKVTIKMPTYTNVPMVPFDNQGDNAAAEANPTYHLVDQTFDVLWRNHVLVFPRFILASSVFPILVGAAMFKVGSVWLYNDVFYLTLSVFLTTAVCVPLYAMTRISVMVAKDGSSSIVVY